MHSTFQAMIRVRGEADSEPFSQILLTGSPPSLAEFPTRLRRGARGRVELDGYKTAGWLRISARLED